MSHVKKKEKEKFEWTSPHTLLAIAALVVTIVGPTITAVLNNLVLPSPNVQPLPLPETTTTQPSAPPETTTTQPSAPPETTTTQPSAPPETTTTQPSAPPETTTTQPSAPPETTTTQPSAPPETTTKGPPSPSPEITIKTPQFETSISSYIPNLISQIFTVLFSPPILYIFIAAIIVIAFLSMYTLIDNLMIIPIILAVLVAMGYVLPEKYITSPITISLDFQPTIEDVTWLLTFLFFPPALYILIIIVGALVAHLAYRSLVGV